MGRKSRLKRERASIKASSEAERALPNTTSIPEDYSDVSTSAHFSRDATATRNISTGAFEPELADTPAKLVDKYFLSGKAKLPTIPIIFILSIGASLWIFVNDNMKGSLATGDWDSLAWTLLKSAIPFGFFIIIWLAHNLLFNWFAKKPS